MLESIIAPQIYSHPHARNSQSSLRESNYLRPDGNFTYVACPFLLFLAGKSNVCIYVYIERHGPLAKGVSTEERHRHGLFIILISWPRT
jgi:hypothetical protein